MPSDTPDDVFSKTYTKPAVVKEVIARALVLAEQFPAESLNPFRQIDIWFVKYGQEPERDYGITTNLQRRQPIEQLYAAVKLPVDGPRKAGLPEGDAA
ncbi:hypothetical protein [Paraburkholderia sp. RL17-337-BIB-A]|uniref:hypothetical protein n=1 Tax=Paraburkholderia sp. RL17-337-BIB-A TaxID=3031636 RepID=UPI0038BDBD01